MAHSRTACFVCLEPGRIYSFIEICAFGLNTSDFVWRRNAGGTLETSV